jgi:myo-inositol-1-phosphate synthase
VVGTDGLPLAGVQGLADYTDIVFAGWDLNGADLASAAEGHEVLSYKQHATVAEELGKLIPWPAAGSEQFVSLIRGENLLDGASHRKVIEKLRADLAEFKTRCHSVVVINLASTEKGIREGLDEFNSLAGLEHAIENNSPEVAPSMLYAYAAIAEGVPYGNFTPSTGADVPALIEFARQQGVPIAGKDGKTGQTFIKTVLAPALAARALHVDGWYSTNLLGNRDGLALSNEDSLAAKVKTKASVLDEMLGYEVEDHIIDIRYYRPRGDNKEAWDNIDIRGFLGQTMQIKVNFLCKDSILAAPLAIEVARCLDLAASRGESGIIEELGAFFKMPMSRSGRPEHVFHKQHETLLTWLAG